MSRCKLLWGDDDVREARRLLTRMPDITRLSARERAWIHVAVELLTPDDVRTSRSKLVAALEALHAESPDDESASFLALALLSATRRGDPDELAVRKRAAELAAGVLVRNPNHPGAAHYIIHAYDSPELARLALPYARVYAKIAPAAFHARHMPAHIFARLGMWSDAIASCKAAWDASVAAARRERLSANHYDFHSLNWIVEMSFELGRRKDADAALAMFAQAVRAGLGRQQRALYASQISSYLMRTREWARVDELLAPLGAPAVDDEPAPVAPRTGETQGHCAPAAPASPPELIETIAVDDAHARAAAMLHDVAATERWLDELDAARTKLAPYVRATQPADAIAKLDEASARHHAAMRARASGDDRALVAALRRAVVDADQETGGENNPSGWLVHEELGDALVRLGRNSDAAAEYALALAAHPGRARSLLGAARSDPKSARIWYGQLAEQWSAADADTDGLAEVRAAATAR
jgi:hypothetical protein